jgi:hypothetical protein
VSHGIEAADSGVADAYRHQADQCNNTACLDALDQHFVAEKRAYPIARQALIDAEHDVQVAHDVATADAQCRAAVALRNAHEKVVDLIMTMSVLGVSLPASVSEYVPLLVQMADAIANQGSC